MGWTLDDCQSKSETAIAQRWDPRDEAQRRNVAGCASFALRSRGINVILQPLANGAIARRIFRLPIAVFHHFFVLLSERFTIIQFFLPEAYLIGAPLALLARVRASDRSLVLA